ncbi:MAG: bifunctional helix-turn-helix transcriptional regulator/GNAT family N-acetyltransferase [Stellaceae bacterium]
MAGSSLGRRVAAMRHFNRFYTRRIGVLSERLLGGPFSLPEVRVLFELAHRRSLTATAIGETLGLDAGYLSRMLKAFERRGYVARTRSPHDGRQRHLALTAAGRRAFAPVDARSQRDVGAMLRPLAEAQRRQLTEAMDTIERLLGCAASELPVTVRQHRPGDIGWAVAISGRVYAEEYGWDATLEAFVAELMARFLRHYDAKREGCWMAEIGGETVGCIALTRQSDRTAKLRTFVVTREARGRRAGKRLLGEALRFARVAGYRKVVLWTQKGLDASRHLYETAGFKLVREEPHHSWGKDHIGQYWEMKL